jgi:RNA polymerase sigma factor (sigma-70 family)
MRFSNPGRRTDWEAWRMVAEHQTAINKYVDVSKSRFTLVGMSPEDLKQEAMLAAFRAAQTYDPTRKTQYMTWARYWIDQAVRDIIRRRGITCCPKRSAPPLYPFAFTDDEIAQERFALVQDDREKELIGKERDRIVGEAVDSLPPRLRTVVKARMRGATLRKVGRSLGITQEGARFLEKKAFRTLRSVLGDRVAAAEL